MDWSWKMGLLFLLVISFGPVLCSRFDPKGPDIFHSKFNFTFTQSTYNGSVEENSAGSTLIVPGGDKMGIWYKEGTSAPSLSVIEYKIVNGDPLKLFRVEERQVGNFCFLIILVNNNERSLNREFKDLYRLQVKATLYLIENEALEEKRLDENQQLNELYGEKSSTFDKYQKLTNKSGDDSHHLYSENLKASATTPTKLEKLQLQNDYQMVVKSPSLSRHSSSSLPLRLQSDERRLWSPDQRERRKSITRNNKNNANITEANSSNKRNKSSKSSFRRKIRDETRLRNKTRSKNRNSGERRKKQREKIITFTSTTSSSLDSQVPITTTPSTTSTITTTTTTSHSNSFSTIKSVLVPISEAYATVLITIKDVNDNIPVFEHPTYDIGVNSDAAVLSKIAKISANDADIGLNQETYYSLTEFSPLFAIDPITAVLSPIRPLGSSLRERHQIRVRAKNRWNNGLVASESTARVNIHIRSTNRRAPQIFVNHPPKIDWRPYGVIFAVVSVRHSGQVDLIIKEGDPNGIFRVTRTTSYNEFYIEMPPIVATNLNYKELTPSVFNLTLKATDKGEPPKSSVHELQINLNEGPWSSKSSFVLFDKDVYEVTISESAPPHSVVFRLKRPDPRIILSISSGNEAEEFSLEKSGVLYTARWLDMETKSSYTLTVDSLDLRPGRIDQVRRHRSVVKIIVRLSDENDNSPIFMPMPGNSTTVYVMENEPIGTKLFKVTARDRDSAENGYITYSIANLKPVPVTIDHFTGEVRTLEILDAEKNRQRYTIRIRASDWGDHPYRRESEMSINLVLKGSNDNRPLFTVSNCVAVIDRNIKFETEFGKLGAIDFDRNDVISYRIVGGNEDGCFSLDSSLGRLRVTCDLRDLRASTRYLNVTASDGEFYSDVHTIKIELRDVLRTNFNKSDSIRTGIKLYSTSQSVFECQDTGVQERFDRLTALYEESNKMEENEVDDESAFSQLSSRYGENSHSPHFVDFPNELTISESVEVGTVLVKLKGRDLDRGYNGLLTFVITGGDETHGAWDIVNTHSSSLTGELVQEASLVVASKLDREEFSSYTLNLTIWDHGNPPKAASKLLSIKIEDANDCTPLFDKAAVRVKVLEGNQLVGKPILQMRATDCDLERTPNSFITYRLLKESSEFSIDEETGEVRMLIELDREKQESYELIVIAQDKGTPRKLSSMATVTIVVEDRNDEKPSFLNVSKIVKIKEDWPVGAIVTKLLAVDRDDGLYGTVRYSLVEGSKGDFVLDPISGVLRVSKELDYEKTFIYNLTISARDLGVPSLSSETFVVVEILNVQETMEPMIRFPDIVFKASVSEESPIGTFLYSVMPPNYLAQFSYPGILFSLEGESQFSFTIDNSGVLRTARMLDYEVQSSHWLTIFARSGINSNNFARLEMFIEVLPVNDCVPLTKFPIYYVEVEENTSGNVSIIHLEAFDCDDNSGLRFAFKTSNPLFEIDSMTGEICTTSTPLDREKQSELSFDVIVYDLGSPPLNSTTKITVKILDQNDNSAIFLDSGSTHTIPELLSELLQEDEADNNAEDDEENQIDVDNEDHEDALKWSDWQVIHVSASEAIADGWRKLHRIVAYDEDEGKNGELRYRLKYRVNAGTSSETDTFSIHYETGDIYTSASSIKSETIIKFIVEASDLGAVPMTTETELILKVKEVNRQESLVAPKVLQSSEHKVTITTREKPGYIVEILDVVDEDSDQLWFEIVSGDSDQHFIIYPDSPNLILAKPIHSQRNFKLNISVSDGFNIVFTRLLVNVIESERISSLIWEQEHYSTRISELISDATVVATVRVQNPNNNNNNWTSNSVPILYGFHNAQDLRSLKIFTIDTLSGVVSVAQASLIDRESLSKHIITLKARDPFNSFSFVRLEIEIEDENDNFPMFTKPRHELRVSESTPAGAFLTQIQAFDADSGDNGRLSYSITFGNVGSTFSIDKNSGRLFLKKSLSVPRGESSLEYNLIVKAVDHGSNSLSATTNVNVLVTLQSEAEFLQLDCSNEDEPQKNELRVQVKENSLPGTYVTTIHVVNSGSVSFEIEDNKNNFWIDPSTGIILVGKNKELLNREIKSSHDFIIRATNSRGATAICNLNVEILDENNNRPRFSEIYYEGEISEDAQVGSLVLAKMTDSKDDSIIMNKSPLILHSHDLDEGINAIVTYSIIEDEEMRTVFHMEPSSGSLNIVTTLDYEKRSNYIFHVRAMDGGGLLSENMATVNVSVRPVNNKVPVAKSSRVDFLVPTAPGVLVHVLEAFDADGDSLNFNITRGNMDKLFEIESKTGKIIVGKTGNYSLGKHVLEISVSDGKFTTTATITIHVKLLERNSVFGFRNSTYQASAVENSTKIVNIISLTVFGVHMNEDLQFSILNPTPYFRIGKTSGVIVTTGVKLDREEESMHQLLVQVRGDENKRLSRSVVQINIQDVNDMCPTFYNLPYYAVVLLDSKPGDFIIKVKALDEDEGENKVVRYELVRSPFGDFYEMDKLLGEIRLRRRLDGVGSHEIIIKAYDGGIPTCTSEAVVDVKIVTRDQPVFDNQWYETTIPENSKLQSTVLTVIAHAKNPILYSIEPGIDEFGIDHLTGTIYVNSLLDYESVQSYKFVVKVTDIINSTSSSAIVNVKIADSNDNIPRFENMAYSFRVAESHIPSNGIIATLKALDNDTNENAVLTYQLLENQNVRSSIFSRDSSDLLSRNTRNVACEPTKWFAIHPNSGSIILKHPLDYKLFHECSFSVRVSDSGIPSLSSETRVNIQVVNTNQNAPIFEQNVYSARVSERSKRKQFIAKVTASDPDFDSLKYAIVHSSYPGSAFVIDANTGIVTLAQPRVLLNELGFTLNISATDSIFTSYCKLEISVDPKNNAVPYFSSLIYEVGCVENCEGCLIASISAMDPDRSVYGKLSYSIADSDDQDLFLIDKDGNVRLSPGMSMDRELKDSHTLEIRAEDGGGWLGHTKMVVKVGDINEFPPKFPVPEYRVTISAKKARAKLPILQVNAIDLDTEFGVHYSIVDLPAENSTVRDSSYFMINQDTGEIKLKIREGSNMSMFGTRLDFQFWVKAQDEQGLDSHVPVKVIILMDGEMLPEIQPQNATFFVKEDAAIGSIVTTFRVTNIDSPQFRVVSSNSDFFQVDTHGNLLLKSRLDQEQIDKHTVIVWAESQDGINVATSQVTIRVLASKDKEHPPHFNSNKYVVKVAEDLPEGSLIFTAHAVDSDKNGVLKVKERYFIQPENHHFAINPEYGWITLMNELDYETSTHHTLHVVATDSEKRQATATVVVEVINVNDIPTTFTEREYFAEVNEDAPEGTIIKTLQTVDMDLGKEGTGSTIMPTYLKYYIVGGNEQETFRISDDAQVTTWRSLDCEIIHDFKLQIAVTDGAFIDYTNLTIKILDINDNPPICPVPEYEHHVLESEAFGTFLLIIEAYDPDYNAQSPIFSLIGEGADDFKIDPESGIVTVQRSLDAEGDFHPYLLTVVAQDRDPPFEECSSILRIYVDDVNDFSPRFTEDMYNFAVKEDAAPGSWIGKVHAEDRDIDVINHKVHYVLMSVTTGSEFIKDQFEVNPISGIISLLRPLDRELISDYNLSIQAFDNGVTPLSSVVQVHVEVRDVNDNEPLFESHYYSTSISELAEASTEVIRVRATSKDIGVNAEITYDIIGGNSYNHFSIHKKTGVITVNASLDYERVREYVLTVRAKDAGIPPLYQQCMVNISLIDANDNSPLFNQNSYSVMIAENSPASTKVVQVTATDIDSGMNSLIRYKLGSGDRMNNFQIDSKGVISVASALDREMIPQYVLEVWAVDSGSPSLSSWTTVAVEIIDVNDEKPIFTQENYSAVVQEDRPIGYTVLTFDVNDADSYPNSIPFSWDLTDLDDDKGVTLPFTVSDSGSLNVAGKLNFQRKQLYRLRVRVFDSGNPPLFSDANVTVKVVESSHWPPVVSSLVVTVLSANSEYPAGIPLGRIHATDFDVHDKLVYSLIKTQSSSSFVIDHTNGTLKSLTPLRAGVYELGIAVTDGRWTARGDAYIKVSTLSNLVPDIQLEANQIDESPDLNSRAIPTIKSRKDMSAFAIVLTVKGHSPQSLLNRMFAFMNSIKEAVAIDSASPITYEVIILSVQSTNEHLNETSENRRKRETEIPSVDVLLAVRKSADGSFVQPHLLVKKLRFAVAQLEAVLGAKITRVTNDICNKTSCERGQCKTVAIFEGTQTLISTETMSLITPNHNLATICYCPAGYGGTMCEKVINACANSECHITGHICVPDTSANGYACLCRKTYCSQDGSCEDQCTQQSISFSGTSFLAYNVGSNLERELSISFKIRTLYTSGTLLYSFGLFDYSLLEIKQGLVQFSVDLGTGKEVLTLTSISVSDNRWHTVSLHLKDNHVILKVDERSTLRQRTQGPARSLHTGGLIYIGAKIIGTPNDSMENMLPSMGYIGCMKDLRYGYIMENASLDKKNDLHMQEVKHYITPGLGERIHGDHFPKLHHENDDEVEVTPPTIITNGKMYPLPLHNSLKDKIGPYLLRSRNISFTCERIMQAVESCKSQPCLNGGICTEDRPNGYKCQCPSRFHGFNCEIDREPCASNPCLNNGICSPTNSADISFSPSVVSGSLQSNQFHCNCVDGTYGSRCERGKWCKDSLGDSDVCHSRGECEEGPVGPVCWCEAGYTGATCQLDINECERGDACGSGSTCVNFLGGFRCLCPENATGRTCNRRSNEAPSIVTNDYHIIILIVAVVASFIVFLIIFVAIRRCCFRRRRRTLTNSIAMTSQGKDKDNRIQVGRDNRDILRNRDSKISNLEVRPVSTGSDIFPSDLRGTVDPIKSYGSAGDDLEKPQFINNLMKSSSSDKRRYGQPSWETNRDDYPKIQNYMKGEISWGSKGSKPNSPIRVDTGTSVNSGNHWEIENQGANISPTRLLPPPPDIPDTLSNISHDSNTEVSDANLNALLSSPDTPKHELEISPDSHCTDEGTSCDENWPLPNPEYCLLNDASGPEDRPELTNNKPLVVRNRYRRSPNNNSHSERNTNSDEEAANENSQLLSANEAAVSSIVRSNPDSSSSSLIPKPSLPSTNSSLSPRKHLQPSSSKTLNNDNSANSKSHIPRKNFRKTTHITEV